VTGREKKRSWEDGKKQLATGQGEGQWSEMGNSLRSNSCPTTEGNPTKQRESWGKYKKEE